MRTIEYLKTSAVLALLFVSIACGSHSSPTAPDSEPSVVAAVPSTVAVTGATIVGTVSGGSSNASARSHTLAVTGLVVTVVGTNISANVASDGSFTLTSVPPSQVVLTFSGPGVNATVTLGEVGKDDRVQVAVTVSGTTATLDTVTSTTSTSSTVSLKGTVGAVAGSCPSLSMTVGGTYVQTSGSTIFGEKRCADIAPGDVAGVGGERRSDGVVLAARVDVAKPAAPPPAPTPAPTPTPTPAPAPAPAPTPVTMSGTIDGVTGSCPSLAMSVSGTYVRTNSATTFSGRSCGDLKTGVAIAVAGTRQSDSTVLATTIVSTAPTPTPTPTPAPTPAPTAVTMNGTIAGVSGTCPSLSMSVSGTYVRTNSSTTFSGKSCGDLKTGVAIAVVGTRQTDSTVLATSIASTASTPTPTPTPTPAPTTATASGTITALGGSCPALSMKVDGTYAITSSATTFSGKTCGSLKTGDAVTVTGEKRSDGVILATSLSAK